MGLKARYPDLIGVGLNDSTALVVRGTKMRVLGKNPVKILDRQPKDPADYPEYSLVNPGECYDLSDRRRSMPETELADE
jgi:cyanophycinase-like exopeptidase